MTIRGGCRVFREAAWVESTGASCERGSRRERGFARNGDRNGARYVTGGRNERPGVTYWAASRPGLRCVRGGLELLAVWRPVAVPAPRRAIRPLPAGRSRTSRCAVALDRVDCCLPVHYLPVLYEIQRCLRYPNRTSTRKKKRALLVQRPAMPPMLPKRHQVILKNSARTPNPK